MATNTGKNHRTGSVKNRTQVQTPSGHWVVRDATTGKFINVKTSSKDPFKGVATEIDGRRD